MQAHDPVLVNRLTEINLEDTFVSLGWEKLRLGRRLAAIPFRGAARRFARQVFDYDQCAASLGLQAGSQEFLKSILRQLVIQGQEHIPARGPVLFLANHPGMMDTVSLFASIPRPDLKIMAADRPFLRALPATSARLVYVPEDPGARMGAIRQTVQLLRQGQAVLTFPAGQIEPDPAVLPGAVESLKYWGSSIGVFARMVPDLQLVPVIVSGVLAPKATHHPLTYLRRKPKDRERLGATIQILSSVVWPNLWRDLWNVSVQVRFGPPILAASLSHLHEPEAITAAVVEKVRVVLESTLRGFPEGKADRIF